MLRNSKIALLVGLFCILSSCENTPSISPWTVPGLFNTWDLNRVDTDCGQSGFNSNVIQPGSSLSLRRDLTFVYNRSGQETITGEFILGNDEITFIPPIFPGSISTTYNYSFSGRNLTTNTTELISSGNGVVETCEVKRRFSF